MAPPADTDATAVDEPDRDWVSREERDSQLLAQIASNTDAMARYLGGIYGLLQKQESTAGVLGELAPMVMQMLGTAGGPGATAARHVVIEGETVNGG